MFELLQRLGASFVTGQENIWPDWGSNPRLLVFLQALLLTELSRPIPVPSTLNFKSSPIDNDLHKFIGTC